MHLFIAPKSNSTQTTCPPRETRDEDERLLLLRLLALLGLLALDGAVADRVDRELGRDCNAALVSVIPSERAGVDVHIWRPSTGLTLEAESARRVM